jgi:hypothetical protein
MKISSKLIRFFRLVRMKKKEKIFLDNQIKTDPRTVNQDQRKLCFFQMPMDYYFLLISKSIIYEKNIHLNFAGSWPYYFKPFKKRFFLHSIIHIINSKILYYFLKKKWQKIYKAINISKVYDFSEFSISGLLYALKNFFSLANQITSKEKLLKLKLDKVIIGDLIYDTYIRYRQNPTVDLSDIYLKFIIFKTLIIYANIKNFFKNKKVEYYFTSYTSYINHGLIVRYFQKKKVKVYSFPKQHIQNFCEKISSKKFYSGTKDPDFIYKKFLKEKNKKKIISIAKKKIELRFKGQVDEGTSYLKISSYKKNKFKINKNFPFEGVLFLHDFYDAPQESGIKIFNDYYEWTEFVLNVIRENKLNIAVKPHPNSKPESLEYNKYLKKKYSDVFFLDKDYPNIQIFSSKTFKTGISVCGSVLYELLYFNKAPLYISKNLVSPLKIVTSPKTKNNYKKLLLNFNKIKVKKIYKNIMLGMFFFYLYSDKSDLECSIAKEIKLKNLDSDALSNLGYFDKELRKKILQKPNY